MATNDNKQGPVVSTKTVQSTQFFNDIKLGDSHPNLYRSIMTFAFMSIALGLNFIFSNPTFHPYGIPKEVIGAIFLTLGSAKFIFLNFSRNVRIVRLLMAMSVSFIIFWTVGTTFPFFTGKGSLQLPIVYVGLCILEIFLLIEPFTNPANANGIHGNGKNGHIL